MTVSLEKSDHPGTWLTSRRLRAHGLLLALALWSVYFWTISTPGLRDHYGNLKGTDFLHFYTLGILASEHRGDELYDMNAQAALAAQRVPQAAGILYLPLYPPQVSILFAPFASLPYSWALGVWWALSALIYSACCYSIWRMCPNLRLHGWTVAILATAFPAFFHLIAWGQTSALALACFTLMLFACRGKHEFLAGIALGCLIFKPQLGLAAAAVFLASGAWKTLAGAAISAGIQVSAGALYYGTQPFREWLRMIENARSLLPALEPRLYQTHCLRTFWSMIIPSEAFSFGLYLASATVILAMVIAVWRRFEPPFQSLRFPALLFATVLIAPHLTVYDIVVLVPALLLLADWLVSETPTPATKRISTALYAVYVLPLIGPLARWTHVQLSVIAMTAVVYFLWQFSRDDRLRSDKSGGPTTRVLEAR